MKRLHLISFVLLGASLASAQSTTNLQLPPGGWEVLPINQGTSFIADGVRVVDCPTVTDEPFGICGNFLFGGLALYSSHLQGVVQIRFQPPFNGVSHFQISHPLNLLGTTEYMFAPQLYQNIVGGTAMLDNFNTYSEGDLNLATGAVTNLTYSMIVANSFYVALGNVNPNLIPPPFTFPGTYGRAEAKFVQRPDGLLDFTFWGSTFLPLGSQINGDPVRMPLPFAGPNVEFGAIQTPGLSLHPHLQISTVASPDPICTSNCFAPPQNTVQQYTLNTRFSDIGDNFTLNIPALGGAATGRSQMQGRLQVQFGMPSFNPITINGKQHIYMPFAMSSLAPEGLAVPPPPLPLAGVWLGWVGHNELIRFPNLTYHADTTAIVDDPYDLTIGELDITTGVTAGPLVHRAFWTQSLLVAILAQNEPRLLPASFLEEAPMRFQNGPNGETVMRFAGTTLLDFSGFYWPNPDYNNPATSFLAGAGSILEPFMNIQAMHTNDTPSASAQYNASQTNVVSSHGESFDYNASIPCSGNGNSSFVYTSHATDATGGVFTMQNLASVACFNSLTSTQKAGGYDTIQFSAFGKWSHDSNPHVATVQISIAADAPYVSIQVDGGSLSVVNTKPATTPIP